MSNEDQTVKPGPGAEPAGEPSDLGVWIMIGGFILVFVLAFAANALLED